MVKDMNLKELKEIVDFEILNVKNPEKIHVLITLSEPSVGVRAYTEVRDVGMGIDWEHGQFRILPSEKICRLGKSYHDAMFMRVTECEGRKYHFCPRCHERVKKSDNFCRTCGQTIILFK